jgi:Ni,Fe-hydrogenase III small subunit
MNNNRKIEHVLRNNIVETYGVRVLRTIRNMDILFVMGEMRPNGPELSCGDVPPNQT